MPKLGLYLAFENAKEAMEYYEKDFNAIIIERLAITKEMNELFKLDEDKLEDSTYSGRFNVDGVVIGCSDRVDNNADFNDSFNIMVEYTKDELDKYEKMINQLKSVTVGKIIYDSEGEEGLPYKMFRFTDKYNIIWSFMLML